MSPSPKSPSSMLPLVAADASRSPARPSPSRRASPSRRDARESRVNECHYIDIVFGASHRRVPNPGGPDTPIFVSMLHRMNIKDWQNSILSDLRFDAFSRFCVLRRQMRAHAWMILTWPWSCQRTRWMSTYPETPTLRKILVLFCSCEVTRANIS